MSKGSSSNGAGAGFVVVCIVIGLLMRIPPEVWVALGLIVACLVLIGLIAWAVQAAEKRRAAADMRAARERAACAAREKQQRLDALGKAGAARVETALAAVLQVSQSEAARAGWLGDVDFHADIEGITDGFQRAHALRAVADRLAALKRPSAEDRRLLAEARTTVADLERASIERVALIGQCAAEARRIDRSLREEREDARIAGQRAELHAELSEMLYGIAATPDPGVTSSAADAVLARVQAYRELKNLVRAR